MKKLKDYIFEKLIINNTIQNQIYKYYPKSEKELISNIKEIIDNRGLGLKNKPLDLNCIDTSQIDDMSYLFSTGNRSLSELTKNGHFDISSWDVSNVEDMECMFWGSSFNGDISKWNTGKVDNMQYMFKCSSFDGDLSKWDVSHVKSMIEMFRSSTFTGKKGDISGWDVSNVGSMYAIFAFSKININIDNWKVKKKIRNDVDNMFTGCPLQDHKPKWCFEQVNLTY